MIARTASNAPTVPPRICNPNAAATAAAAQITFVRAICELRCIRQITHNAPVNDAVLVAIRYGSACSSPHTSQVANVRTSSNQATSDNPAVDRLRTIWMTCANENTPDRAAARTPVITDSDMHAVSVQSPSGGCSETKVVGELWQEVAAQLLLHCSDGTTTDPRVEALKSASSKRRHYCRDGFAPRCIVHHQHNYKVLTDREDRV